MIELLTNTQAAALALVDRLVLLAPSSPLAPQMVDHEVFLVCSATVSDATVGGHVVLIVRPYGRPGVWLSSCTGAIVKVVGDVTDLEQLDAIVNDSEKYSRSGECPILHDRDAGRDHIRAALAAAMAKAASMAR